VKEPYELSLCKLWLLDRFLSDRIETIIIPLFLIPVESRVKVKIV
jgi:hypothetical protein